MLPFLNLQCRRSEYCSGWTRKKWLPSPRANDRAFRGNGERAFAGDDRVFMLFEVRHVPYKMRFALNNHRFTSRDYTAHLKAFRIIWLKDATQFMDGCYRLAGAGANGVQFALMWAVLAFLLNYVPKSAR